MEFYKAITLLEYNLAPGKGPLSADPRSSCRKKNNGTKIENKEIMRRKLKTITKKVRPWLELDSEAKGNLVMMQVLKRFSSNRPLPN